MTFTVLNRRVHLYLALFLVPWVLVYGLSAMVMNHLPFFRGFYGQNWGRFVAEKETVYEGPLPEGADAKAIAPLILKDLNLEGAHGVNAKRDGSQVTIHRNGMITPRRITFTPADQKVIVERQTFQWPLFLRRLHVRRGYDQPYLADTLWAMGVDLFVVGVLLWGITGLWTWYQMKRTRPWGVVCIAAGCGLFAVFLVTI